MDADTYLRDIRRTFGNYRALAEAAVAQIADDQLFTTIDPDANSIAIVMQHVAGNLRSRFQDFLTADGEKPDRDRDAEFEPQELTRDELLRTWAAGWDVALQSIGALTAADLDRTITIRGEPFAIVEALSRSATHTAYHVGQMVLLAKHFAGPAWRSLSIPKGQSKGHTQGQFKAGIIPPR